MSEDVVGDDSSHYEISLTSGQAFVAFILLMLSLAASFAFGILIGRGNGDDRLIVRREPQVVSESSVNGSEGRIAELGATSTNDLMVGEAEPDPGQTSNTPLITEMSAPPAESAEPAEPIVEPPAANLEKPAVTASEPAAESAPDPAPAARPVPPPAATAAPSPLRGPVYAQLMSTSDGKTAEALAARLIDGGFKAAYDERTSTPKGMMYRVRVKFASEPEARQAIPRLRGFGGGDVWITR